MKLLAFSANSRCAQDVAMHVTSSRLKSTLAARPFRTSFPRPFASQPQARNPITVAASPGEVEKRYGWTLSEDRINAQGVREVKVADIRRPLGRTRSNDAAKVEALMQSITKHGLKEPIDVLEVDGRLYGFSGCHRYEACQRLGKETILCRIRKATPQTLRMHMM